MIRKILIANRGEIACRIGKTAKKLGIQTVAIYSDIDKNSRFVDLADEAYCVGPPPALQSYLQSGKILEIAKDSNCHALHPAFGFLSENADFADECEQNNIKFIGPPSKAIRLMGSKSESKKIMINANVPVVPGYHGDNQDPEYLKQQSIDMGFPVIIKAVLGGGGKGMRVVRNAEEFDEMLDQAKRESLKAFKDQKVLVEKYITKPRHIEIQVFGDHHGNYVYLFERDCSIQRRHQKVIEEAPSNVGEKLRHEMGVTAMMAAKAVGYYNAGTVEFIFDVDSDKFYFMEMNTRIQVEHPITEMITGQDIVQWQINVANGYKLPLKQEELKINGHSIESRIYSEEPFNQFLPGSGKLQYFRQPEEVDGVRIDTGVRQNDEISIFYDPMIAKLITWAPTREEAIKKMDQALCSYRIYGLPNNIKFLKNLVRYSEFEKWDYDTGFIEKYGEDLVQKKNEFSDYDVMTAILAKVEENIKNSNIYKGLTNFRNNHNLKQNFDVAISAPYMKDVINYQIELEYLPNNKFNVTLINGEEVVKSYKEIFYSVKENGFLVISAEDSFLEKEYFKTNEDIVVFDINGDPLNIQFTDNLVKDREKGQDDSDPKIILAPMPCTVVKLNVKVDQIVKKDQVLVILEAMKMEHQVKSKQDGKVKAVKFKEGDFCEANQLIIELEDN